MTLNLEAKTPAEQKVKAYLEQNASEVLAHKINEGVKIVKDGKTLLNKKITYLSSTSRVSLIVFKALYVILLPISFSFDTYICMFSYRYLHRSTRVGRTVYYCDTISSPKCDDHITRVER